MKEFFNALFVVFVISGFAHVTYSFMKQLGSAMKEERMNRKTYCSYFFGIILWTFAVGYGYMNYTDLELSGLPIIVYILAIIILRLVFLPLMVKRFRDIGWKWVWLLALTTCFADIPLYIFHYWLLGYIVLVQTVLMNLSLIFWPSKKST